MKKMLCLTVVLTLALLCFCGCAAKAENGMPYYDAAVEEVYEAAGDDALYYEETTAASQTAAGSASLTDNRKLIRNLSLSVETEDFPGLITYIESQVAACGGYIEYMEANTRPTSTSRYASMTIRIPVANLEHFAGGVSENSNVTRRTESTQDITTTYVDTESRKEALTVEQERLLALLEQAESLEDILALETRLTEIRYELESIESRLRTYDNQVQYATISLDVNEVQVFTDVEEKGFWEELGEDFVDSLKGAWMLICNIFAFLIVALPYLFICALVALGIILPICIHKKKKRARKEKAEKEAEL